MSLSVLVIITKWIESWAKRLQEESADNKVSHAWLKNPLFSEKSINATIKAYRFHFKWYPVTKVTSVIYIWFILFFVFFISASLIIYISFSWNCLYCVKIIIFIIYTLFALLIAGVTLHKFHISCKYWHYWSCILHMQYTCLLIDWLILKLFHIFVMNLYGHMVSQ